MATITSGKDAFDSISEGCFLVLPQSRRSNASSSLNAGQKRKRSSRKATTTTSASQRANTSVLENDGFQPLFSGDEPSACVSMRHKFFQAEWKRMNDLINDILLDTNSAVINSIADFVNHSAQEQGLVALPFHEIPTALVFAGINTPDHETQFEQIVSHLRRDNHYVALLQSKDCGNIRNMTKTMIEQFLSETMVNDDQQELMDEPMFQFGGSGQSGAKSVKRSKLPPYDFQILEGWYRHASRNKQSNLVVVLQDIETFEAQVLQDFISICSEYRRRLPIVFIMGIATSSEILHQSLTKASISLLRVEKFWLEQSEVWLNRVLETLFIERSDTLKFGPRPFRFLVDHFYLYDFSMGKVTASLKYALMHHFYANPLSILLPLLGYDAQRLQSTLTEWHEEGILCIHHATFLRMLPSFRMHVNALADQDPHEALCLLDDDAYLMTKALPQFVLGLQRYHHHFRYGIELIRILHQQFPDITGLRKPKRELLRMALESDTAALGEAIRLPADLLRKCEGDKLRRFLQQLHAVTMQFSHEEDQKEEGGQGERGEDNNNNNMTLLEDWIERLQHTLDAETTKAQEAKMKKREKKLDAMVTDTTRHTVTAKKVQDESVKYLRKTGTDKTKIAMEVADWISRTLKKCLMQSITSVPMYELAYYTNVRLHEKSFSAQPRASVQTGLGQAHHYLNCSCCTRPEHVMPTEHDTCILYKLYLECGRMINLYDWFVAFGCILEREKRSERLDEKEVQARFVRSVAELQFLGFIKSTQRKTDHVQRLTWSNI